MCQKRQRRCAALLELREQALAEWVQAETLSEVRSAWARLGGLTTAHRYGPEWFGALARRRHGQITVDELATFLARLPERLGS